MNGALLGRINMRHDASDPPPGPYPMGLMGVLATVAMLFAAFTAAILVRRTGTDWVRVTLPSIVWINAVVLIGSTVAVEIARASFRRGASTGAIRPLASAVILGVVFLAGQVVAWRVLAAQGVFLPSSPHAAFFYMLSAVHGLHVLGGLAALIYTLRRAATGVYATTNYDGLTYAAVFWHFVGAVWIYVLVLLATL